MSEGVEREDGEEEGEDFHEFVVDETLYLLSDRIGLDWIGLEYSLYI